MKKNAKLNVGLHNRPYFLVILIQDTIHLSITHIKEGYKKCP